MVQKKFSFAIRPTLDEQPEPRDDYQRAACHICGRAVWQRPAFEKQLLCLLKKGWHPFTYVCIHCAMKHGPPYHYGEAFRKIAKYDLFSIYVQEIKRPLQRQLNDDK